MTLQGDSISMRQVDPLEYVLLEEDGETESNIRRLAIDVDNPAAETRGDMFGLTITLTTALARLPAKSKPSCVCHLLRAPKNCHRIGICSSELSGVMEASPSESCVAVPNVLFRSMTKRLLENSMLTLILLQQRCLRSERAAVNMTILSLLAPAIIVMMLQ
eukprot:scaffold3073_cov66-Cylindrotheca_fusiformis.AAC.16